MLALGTGSAIAGCYSDPSTCGYPDPGNTGVPAGTSLTQSGSKTISTNGAVIDGLDISGTVTVAADNVTIQNSRITRTSGGSGTYAVILNNGADNFTIKDTEILGPSSNSGGLQSAVWNHYDNPGATALRVNFHRCADCWEGSATFRDSYMLVDAAYSGSHDENVYVCSTTVVVEHSTMVNLHDQTATVFGDTICGGGNDFTVTDSLLAGGGFLLYPQANSNSKVGSMTVTGNRFARCTTSPVYHSGSGGTTCSGGADSNGIYPKGGYYGVAAFYYSGAGHVWEDNVWDDNSQPVCPSGSSGCGQSTPPPDGEDPPPPDDGEDPPPPDGEDPPPPDGEDPPPPDDGEDPPGPDGSPAEAIWTAPPGAAVGIPVTLDGTASTGDPPIGCQWSFEDQSGGTIWETHDGCAINFTFQLVGTKYVRLTVTDGDGDSDSDRQSFAATTQSTPPEDPGDSESPEDPGDSESPEDPGDSESPEDPGDSESPEDPEGGSQSPPAPSDPGPAPPTDPGGPAPGSDDGRAEAIWDAPDLVRVGRRLTLDGTGSRGARPLRCRWRFETGRRSRRSRTAKRGCKVAYRFRRRAAYRVTLVVGASDGTRDSLRRTIRAVNRPVNARAAFESRGLLYAALHPHRQAR